MNKATVDTKKEILRSANRLLRRRSFNSFSYKDIAEEVGIKKASIHYHYPTKNILGIETIKYYKERISHYISELEKRTDDPVEHIEAFVHFFRNMLSKNLMCPAGVLSMEITTLAEEMRIELSNMFNYYINWLTSVVSKAREQNKIKPMGTEKDQAMLIAATVEGAMLLSRGLGGIDNFDAIVNNFYDSLLKV